MSERLSKKQHKDKYIKTMEERLKDMANIKSCNKWNIFNVLQEITDNLEFYTQKKIFFSKNENKIEILPDNKLENSPLEDLY